MLVFEKISEVNKSIASNEALKRFQIKLIAMSVAIVKKVKLIDSRVKRHERQLAKLGADIKFLESNGVKNPANFAKSFNEFKENIYGLDGSHLAQIHNDLLEKDLTMCESKEDQDIVIKYYEVKSTDTLTRVDLLKRFYVAMGFSFEVKKANSKKRTRKATAKVSK